MRRILLLLMPITCALNGQAGRLSEKWEGAWILEVQQSSFGPMVVPGVPSDLKVLWQELQIEIDEATLRISGDTTVRAAGKRMTSKEDTRLNLDGAEVKTRPATLRLHLIHPHRFEIVSIVRRPRSEHRQVSRFVLSQDAKTITETKSQTVTDVGTKSNRSSTSTLVFSRKP